MMSDLILGYYTKSLPITVAARSKARLLEHWNRVFEYHLRHGCLCAFVLCFCYSVCRQRPCDKLILRPRSQTDCVWIKKLKRRQTSTRAVEPYIDRY
jgi:hypothetical protein